MITVFQALDANLAHVPFKRVKIFVSVAGGGKGRIKRNVGCIKGEKKFTICNLTCSQSVNQPINQLTKQPDRLSGL